MIVEIQMLMTRELMENKVHVIPAHKFGHRHNLSVRCPVNSIIARDWGRE